VDAIGWKLNCPIYSLTKAHNGVYSSMLIECVHGEETRLTKKNVFNDHKFVSEHLKVLPFVLAPREFEAHHTGDSQDKA